jgi:hypothetical protein
VRVPKAGVRQNPLLRWTQTVVERRAAIALRVAVKTLALKLSTSIQCPVSWRRLNLEPLARKQIAET